MCRVTFVEFQVIIHLPELTHVGRHCVMALCKNQSNPLPQSIMATTLQQTKLCLTACQTQYCRGSARQVLALCEKPREPQPRFIVADTPGQIEIFTWSASGAIITEALASAFPTMVAFVVDTPRCAHPQTFMSNMLQARPLGV